jgi:hypothetical protein
MNAEYKTVPESLPTTAGTLTRPTEAERTSILIMASGRAFRKERPDALPDLPGPV